MNEIKVTTKGNWNSTENWLRSVNLHKMKNKLAKYAMDGVLALTNATPRDTGKTAMSWDYEIHESSGKLEIVWTNSNMARPNVPIALLIQYGHAKKNGGFVSGVDYINPALKPIFQKMADDIWKEMTK